MCLPISYSVGVDGDDADVILSILKERTTEYYEEHPDMREPRRKFGLKGAQFQAYGATPYKTDNFRDQATRTRSKSRLELMPTCKSPPTTAKTRPWMLQMDISPAAIGSCGECDTSKAATEPTRTSSASLC